jgi:hypothetical protein
MFDSETRSCGASLVAIFLALFIMRGAIYLFLLSPYPFAIEFFRPTPHPFLWQALAATLSYWVPLVLSVALLAGGFDNRYVIVIPNSVFVFVFIGYNSFFKQWPTPITGNGIYGWAYGFPGSELILVMCTVALLEALLNVLTTRSIRRRGGKRNFADHRSP